MDDNFWMQEAMAEALLARDKGEVPVGAVLVDANGVCIARAHNQSIQLHDPCAHAEILALRSAGAQLNNYRLVGATLYVTLEPCCMCAGALVHARVKRVVFATRDAKAGAVVSVYSLLNGAPLNHAVEIDEGILHIESATLLRDFFKARRNKTSFGV
jgi:tRNA(adenine34) deaminase